MPHGECPILGVAATRVKFTLLSSAILKCERLSKMEIMIPEFEPHFLLKNGHAMTIAAALVPRRFDIPAPEARRFQVDKDSWLLGHCHWQPGKRKDAPVLVLVHGLEARAIRITCAASRRRRFIAAFTWCA